MGSIPGWGNGRVRGRKHFPPQRILAGDGSLQEASERLKMVRMSQAELRKKVLPDKESSQKSSPRCILLLYHWGEAFHHKSNKSAAGKDSSKHIPQTVEKPFFISFSILKM